MLHLKTESPSRRGGRLLLLAFAQMKKTPTLVLLVLFCFAKSLCGQQSKPLADGDIRELLRDIVDKQKRAPGIVVGLIDTGGPRIFNHGTHDADSTNELNGDTVFEIGSITKAFTGILLAQMIQHEQVALEDAAQNYLPASVKLPTREGKQITLRHLTTHTSGLSPMPNNFRAADPDNPYADYTVQQLYAFLGRCELNRTPGEKYDYSNLGAGLLGHILALKAGTNYEALVRKEICSPLKMDDTLITLTAGMKNRLAPGHNSAGVRVKNWDLPTLAGAGALRSTAKDMLKFLTANMGLQPSPLRPALEQSHVPRFKNSDMEFGMGWHIRPAFGARYVWHNGGTGGYHSFAAFDPKAKRGVVVLANSANAIDDLGWHLLNPQFKVENITARQVATIDFKVYDEYVGRYKFPLHGEFVITRNGNRLLAKLDAQPALEIFPESATKFFVTVVDAQISFVKDEQGKVSHLILHQNGLDQKAKKAN